MWCNMANIYLYQPIFLKLGLGGIPSFKLVECGSKATIWMKLRDFHMQRYLVGKWLFMGWNIEIFDGDNLCAHGPTLIIAHMLANEMDQHPCTTNGEDNQLVVLLVEHGLLDQQNTKVVTYTISLPTTILMWTTKNPTQFSLKLNSLLQRYFIQLEPNLNFITHLANLS